MEKLDEATKTANLEAYKEQITAPKKNEPEVRVRVVVPPGLWWGPTPGLHKLYGEGEELMVPESVYKNSDYHNPKKSVNGLLVRGVLELADRVQAGANPGSSEDMRYLQDRIKELERQNAVLSGNAAVPLVTVDEPKGGKQKSKREEI
jgi:hypothetical protein